MSAGIYALYEQRNAGFALFKNTLKKPCAEGDFHIFDIVPHVQ